MRTVVRPARGDDRQFILSLAPRFAEHRPPTRERDTVLVGTRRWLEDAFDRPPPAAALLVAEYDGVRTGFVYLNTVDDFFAGTKEGHISEIAVVEDHRGTGAALMSAAEAWARACGYRRLTLNVFQTNTGAQEFYSRLGYAPETRQFVKLLA